MIINGLDGYYTVFDTKNRNTELDTLLNNPQRVIRKYGHSLSKRIARIISLLEKATSKTVRQIPGRVHELKNLGLLSIDVMAQWRMLFSIDYESDTITIHAICDTHSNHKSLRKQLTFNK